MKKMAFICLLVACSVYSAQASLIETFIDQSGTQIFRASSTSVEVGSPITFSYFFNWAALVVPERPAGTYYEYVHESVNYEWNSGDGQISYGDSVATFDYETGYFYSSATFNYDKVGTFQSTFGLELLQQVAISAYSENTELDLLSCVANFFNIFRGCTKTTMNEFKYEGQFKFITQKIHTIEVTESANVSAPAGLLSFSLALIYVGFSRRKK
jgi:hypothetical protein